MHDSYFKEPVASELEVMRQKSRQKSPQITFDCYNAIYPRKGSQVKCKLGHKMGSKKDGSMELASVMTGRSGIGCRHCKDFEGD